MLVLSRRLDEKILLPTVPALIKVISSQGGLVRLGIEAPSHVPILREELTRNHKISDLAGAPGDATSGRHILRNRLHNLSLGLALLRMQLVECDPAVSKTLAGIEEELQALRGQIATATSTETTLEAGTVA
jgi:carbon storage regulator